MDTTIYQKLPAVMEMYDAYDAEHQAVYAFKASGKVSGAFINIYPPGDTACGAGRDNERQAHR